MRMTTNRKSERQIKTRWGTNRFPHSTKYVRHSDVPLYKSLGWDWTAALVDTHHGEHSAMMIWTHDGDPKMPEKNEKD